MTLTDLKFNNGKWTPGDGPGDFLFLEYKASSPASRIQIGYIHIKQHKNAGDVSNHLHFSL